MTPPTLSPQDAARLIEEGIRLAREIGVLTDAGYLITRLVAGLEVSHAEILLLRNEVLGEREARDKTMAALRSKDEAMGVLFERLNKAGIDCSDLIS